jgi:predicted N-formylglutamate amidohydrolase
MSAPDLSEAAIAELTHQAIRLIPAERPRFLLLCEHAGNAVPAQWRGLGLAPPFFQTHFAWDAGAGALTEALAKRLPATAILASYSRLFLDVNRLASAWDCIRPDLAGIPVPANLHLDDRQRAEREQIARLPFDKAVEPWLAGRPVVVSIHTFTPIFSGKWREPDIGVLWRKESGLGPAVLEALRRQTCYAVGDNQPYDWNASEGYTLRRHGLDQGLQCLYLEVRSSLLEQPEEVDRIAALLAPALTEAASDRNSGHQRADPSRYTEFSKFEMKLDPT